MTFTRGHFRTKGFAISRRRQPVLFNEGFKAFRQWPVKPLPEKLKRSIKALHLKL